MINEIVLPTDEALQAFGLSRFVSTKNTNDENPFIKTSVGRTSGPGADPTKFLNEVTVNAYEYQPIRALTVVEGGVVKVKYDTGGPPKELGKFRILLTDNNQNLTMNHTWESAGSILDSGYNVLNKAENFLNVASAGVSNLVSRAGLESRYESPAQSRTDYQQTYKDSDFPAITLKFQLFTNNNFMRDIFDPLFNSSTGGIISLTHPLRVVGAAGDAGQATREFLSMNARQYSLTPPALFDITHQSGIYQYVHCFCTNYSIDFDGPWYNAENTTIQQYEILKQGFKLPTIKNKSFPSRAAVSMTFKSSERQFRDYFNTLTGATGA